MSDLRELYQELILDHGRRPRNFKDLPGATHVKNGFNPLCGDRLTLFLKTEDQQIVDIAFQGCGCAISMASSSLMTEAVKGKLVSQAKDIFKSFHAMVMLNDQQQDFDELGKLAVLKGVAEFPARVKCATLAWHTLIAALENSVEPVSTE
jgi:nitrogen fixation NifU-like protein